MVEFRKEDDSFDPARHIRLSWGELRDVLLDAGFAINWMQVIDYHFYLAMCQKL